MTEKRQIKGKEFIADLRSGMLVADLMDKYQLNPEGLRRIFRILVTSAGMKKADLEGLPSLYEESEDIEGLRRSPRKKVAIPLSICDDIEALKAGKVLDVSQSGMRVKGIQTEVGEAKTLMVRPTTMGKARPFVFEAICRWVNKEGQTPDKWTAGFEITRISALDSQELQNLILR